MFQQKGDSVLLSRLKVQGTDLRYGCMQVMERTFLSSVCFSAALPPLALALFSGSARILSSLWLVLPRERGLLHIMSPAEAPGLR